MTKTIKISEGAYKEIEQMPGRTFKEKLDGYLFDKKNTELLQDNCERKVTLGNHPKLKLEIEDLINSKIQDAKSGY